MKKSCTSFLFLVVLVLMTACQSSDHMMFWDTAIDGPKQEFIQKIQKKQSNAKVLTEVSNKTLIGPFKQNGVTGYFVLVASKPDVDVVNQVSLLYPTLNSWRECETKYNELKEELTKKYGEPVGSVEQFQNPNVPDNQKLSKFFLSEAEYSTLYYDEKGSVELAVKGYGYSPLYSVRITVTYIDGINNESYEDVGDECWGEE